MANKQLAHIGDEAAADGHEALGIIIFRHHSEQHEVKPHKQPTLLTQTQYNNG